MSAFLEAFRDKIKDPWVFDLLKRTTEEIIVPEHILLIGEIINALFEAHDALAANPEYGKIICDIVEKLGSGNVSEQQKALAQIAETTKQIEKKLEILESGSEKM